MSPPLVNLNFRVTSFIAQRLKVKQQRAVAALEAKLQYLMVKLQQKIQMGYLSGQVLHQRSGKLKASIVAEIVEVRGAKLIGTVHGAGGPAWYGAVHEFGGRRQYVIRPVTKKALAFFPASAQTRDRSGRWQGGTNAGMLKGILRRMQNPKTAKAGLRAFHSSGGVVVKGVIHPPLPKRSFMRAAAEEMEAEIIRELQETLNSILSEP